MTGHTELPAISILLRNLGVLSLSASAMLATGNLVAPEILDGPAWVFATVAAAGLTMLATSGRRMRGGTADAVGLAAIVLTPLLIGVAAFSSQHLESPLMWLLIVPSFWVARRARMIDITAYMAACAVAFGVNGLLGERDELWRGAFMFVLIAGISISELKLYRRLQRRGETLAHTRAQLERAVSEAALASIAERHAVAGDIHDFPLQRVIAVKMRLNSLVRNLADSHSDDVTDVLAGLQEAIDAMRQIIHGMQPDSIRELSLEDALAEHARILSSSYSTRIDVHPNEPKHLNLADRLLAYRLIAEAMTNAAKHALADRIRVCFKCETDVLIAKIADDGKGMPEHGTFTDALPPSAGTGLTLLHGQLRATDGAFCIDSNSEGTTLTLRIPFYSHTKEAETT